MRTGSAEASRQTVLIVDDTPENLTILGELLQPLYHVRAANSGERALRAVGSEPRPDIVLLDVMMPDLNGYEVIRRMRADKATGDIPVIFVSSLDDAGNEERGLGLGAVDYITKPVNPAIVLARVRAQLELKQARDRLAGQNHWLEAEVTRRMRENLLVQDLSLQALACLAEARDNETGYHILRTRGYVSVLARQLAGRPRFAPSLGGARLEMTVKAAPLHDVGKVGIPDSILLKPGPLTAAEFETMKEHPKIGAEAITKAIEQALAGGGGCDATATAGVFPFLDVAREIALSHHEKWDGSGYPFGLVGDDIPVSGRLMALADVFDALVSRRVYKPPMPFDEAKAIIRDASGRHFDPEVVDAFLSNFEQFAEIANRYAEPAASAA